MSVVAIAPRRWKKPPLIKRAWLRWTIGLGAAVYLALALGTTEVNWVRVWEGLPRGARFFAAFFPPDFASRWTEIADGILESIWMTVVSTVIGIAISIPVGIGATLNTAFDRYEFDSAAAILLIIIAIVMLMEYSSGYLRRWVQ